MENNFEVTHLAQQLKQLAGIVQRQLSTGLKELEIPLIGNQIAILVQLAQFPAATITQKQLERTFQLSHPTMRGLIQSLVKLHFIETQPMAQDQRQIALVLTPAGIAFLVDHADKLRGLVDDTEDQLAATLRPDEQQQLKHLMALLLESVA
ncbi:MarR family winged helix-turn-helix transcriptional regulator [Lactiplantibacillus mudanjiangensis]|uniref:HTH marR-type domain-containing protein n=1 Tax=Lactiplantibacillus mudanjiangensis TaxID=1296538 RepID=A0A660DVJ4_9LACO|nr:MarR family transcriptional regulator [Lactiplantibacillus mudanjiangensis]VDG20264.1 hypothetical protein [Lactobacillus paracollinoides] [Lactiplantibacillus mudanjiangensis]VDG24045.1 hypothetical protein [Lactobacillus paracollinoides] [Lactiplantibacillus mudanjiangensis]VDG27290.1 hypothetical protein [Lactobacillus paracollinoides] [Lactiplantibacillus mudanjiangensis]VDG33858.1 hypothetical protein [Lactobacillus paracollinoides] [Lactiplantibacillus mudanjiangensis]